MSNKQAQGLAKVVQKYGFAVDPWVNEQSDGKYMVIDGEHRIRLLMQEKKHKTVKVKIFHVSYTELQILRQVGNKLRGLHSRELDAAEYRDILGADMLTDLADMLGVPESNLDSIMEHFTDEIIPKDADDAPAKNDTKKPKSKPHIVYLLGGRHRVMCGDSTNPDDVKALFGNDKASQILTDPPYGVDIQAKHEYMMKEGISVKHQTRTKHNIMNDEGDLNYHAFFASFLKLIPLTNYNTIYIFMGYSKLYDLMGACIDTDLKMGKLLFWLKNNITMSRQEYNLETEMVWYGWKGKHKSYAAANSTNVLRYNSVHKANLHPTMKPIAMMRQLVSDGSKKGDIIYDPFLGSGTTLMAADMLGRTCYGMEKDPAYVDVILERYKQKHPGDRPKKQKQRKARRLEPKSRR